MGRTIVFCCFILLGWSSLGQRSYTILRFDEVPEIDGVLDEPVWEKVNVADDFTVNSPLYGAKSEFKSEYRLFYDDDALYIGGRLYDPNPDSVSYTLSQRDDFGNADWASVTFDPYSNNVSAFTFVVTAAGVEIDGLESAGNGFDRTWNAVWRSAVSKTEYGWSFEMKIPYSAIRFPNKPVQDWNINFSRTVRRNRELSYWNPVDPQVFGEITQSGRMVGLTGIESPLRLSVTPYTTGYLENSYDNVLGKQTWKRRVTGGMDLKYGLNDAFTLDMTLIPDFGQTISDQQILNLGPFEVQFNENRPFFLEGTDLFQIGNVFYSRRIGGTPYNFNDAYSSLEDGEEVRRNPNAAPLINGTKVSGRTKSGLGIGVFNSIEGKSQATIVDSLGNERTVDTNPYTNYNVFVLSQNLQNNSTISFVNTNVTRVGEARDANVSVVESNLFSKDGKYRVSSTVKLSSIFEDEVTNGHSFNTQVAKVSGVWRYNLRYWEESDTYDPNDLGFLYNNNVRGYAANLSWNEFKASRYFFRRSVNIGWYYTQLYKPQLYQNQAFEVRAGGLLKQQAYVQIFTEINPFGEVNHFESREFGKELLFNPNMFTEFFLSSDYSKRVALDMRVWVQDYFNTDQLTKSLFVSPRLRISDRMNLIIDTRITQYDHDFGYVSSQLDAYDDLIIIGQRNRLVVENSIRSQFVFTKRMGIDLRLRHYWQQVKYEGFHELVDEGIFRETDYFPLNSEGLSSHNTNYNAFTLDVNFRWIFIPGSELTIFYKNNIFNSKTSLEPSYFTTFETLFDQPQVNSISLRFLIFLDAMYLRRKDKNYTKDKIGFNNTRDQFTPFQSI